MCKMFKPEFFINEESLSESTQINEEPRCKMKQTKTLRNNEVHLNNLAVSLMSTGNFELAASHLIQALRSCQSVLQGHVSIDLSLIRDDNTLDLWMIETLPDGGMNRTISDGGDYVYTQAIKISPDSIIRKSEDLLRAVLSVTVIFNLALAHHQQAIANKGKNPQVSLDHMRKAARVYQLAHRFHRELSLDANPFFALVIFNNLGHTHQSLQDEELANSCFRFVISRLTSTINCSRSQGSAIPKEVIDGLFGNSCHLLLLRETIIASAA